jgi:hypothetical protein
MTQTLTIHVTTVGKVLSYLLRLDPADEEVFESRRATLQNREHVLHDMSIIDTKSSALLTHVSIMLAVVAVLLAQPNVTFWRWVFTTELIAFSAAGVLLLRCVDIMGPPFRQLPPLVDGQLEAFYRSEVVVRRAIFQIALRAVRLFTLCLIGIVALKSVLDGLT